MPMTIENIGQLIQTGNVERTFENSRSAIQAPELPGQVSSGAQSFGQMLKDSLEKTNELQAQADRAVKELVAGRNKNIHETMLMVEKADMSFRMMMQVRNKVLDAYREVMRMQV